MKRAVGLFVFLGLLFPATVRAGDFVDTWVTFLFADDNVFAGPKDRSPGAGFQQVDDEIFFENLESEKRGQETLTQLVLYKRMPSYFPKLDVEAALVIELENFQNSETGETETVVSDDGSYLKMNFFFDKVEYEEGKMQPKFEGDNFSITGFPVDSQRFLLGYAYDIAWGGEKIFPGNTGQVPGIRLMTNFGRGNGNDHYVFVGAKSARLLNEEIHELQTYYGYLAGCGFDLAKALKWEVNGGYFERGAFPPQGEDTEIGGVTVDAYGASTRLTVHQGAPVGTSVDFRLYKNDPDAGVKFTTPEKYDTRTAWNVSAEGTYITQALLDWEDAETTVMQPATAGAMQGKLRFGKTRLHGDLFYRDLSFILFNIPGIAPYRAFPEDGEQSPEWFVAGGLDYYLEAPRLTPGFIVGYKRPAQYKSGDVITVYRDDDDWETLPSGENAFDIVSAKGNLKWDVAPFFAVIGEARYSIDKNRTRYDLSEDESGRERVFEEASVTNSFGYTLMMQARF